MPRSCILLFVLASGLAAVDIPAGSSLTLAPTAVPAAVRLAGTLVIAPGGTTVPVTALEAVAPQATATIDLGPCRGQALAMTGPVTIRRHTGLAIVGDPSTVLTIPSLEAEAYTRILAEGPSLRIGSLSGAIVLDGSGGDGRLASFAGPCLQKRGTGTWTITGDNHAQAWYTSVEGGRLALAAHGALGSGSVSVASGATLALATGATVASRLGIADGGCLDLADGTIAETRLALLAGPTGGTETIVLDLAAGGPDRLVLEDVTDSNDIRGRIVFRQAGPALAAGTWTFATIAKPGRTLMEHHFGFGFTGDPADHSHIVATSRLGAWRLTIRPVERAGSWIAMTVTVDAAPAGP